ncbi:MAG: transporter [Gemmatimonadales bacterium]
MSNRGFARVIGLTVVAMILFRCLTTDAVAQSNPPITGHYPGGHVGIRGGASPPPGGKNVNVFFRFQDAYALKGDEGNTVQDDSKLYFSNIWVFFWTTKKKILGGNYGFLAAVPIVDTVQRPNGLIETTCLGLGDIALVPFLVATKKKTYDLQWGIGGFAPTGSFQPGSTDNHGNGFWNVLGSVGAVWYPGGNRRSWSLSGVMRIEFNGEQEDTDIDVGDDVVLDWGVAKLLPVGKKKDQFLDVGVSGFATAQFAAQTGPTPQDDAPKYRVFAAGPEVHWMIPKHKLSFLARLQFEFGARNTIQSHNLWLAVGHIF